MEPFLMLLIISVFGIIFLILSILIFRNQKKIKNQTSEINRASLEDQKENLSSPNSLQRALEKTEKNFLGRIRSLFVGGDSSPALEQIEEILYTSDLGPKTVERMLSKLSKNLNFKEKNSFESIQKYLKQEFLEIFSDPPPKKIFDLVQQNKPLVLMIVGVNGAGKTTTIGKLSAFLAEQNLKVLVAAGDTFRAAASQQLKAWTHRSQAGLYPVEFFEAPQTKDPGAVAFEALQKAKNYDVVIIDTAGRLHTQNHLMEELKKVKRVMKKVIPEAPQETWIVLDANSGQNALSQAREFHQSLQLTGVIVTKLDGSAKGGVTLGVVEELKLPIVFVGIGEKVSDLKVFSASEFVESLFL